MHRNLIAAILAAAATTALGQPQMEPGEWEFTNTMTSPMLPAPQTMTTRTCVKKEDTGDPMRWSGKQSPDCKITPKSKSADSYSWEMACPSSGMRGTGTARYGRGTVESEMRMSGSSTKGDKFDMTTKMSGRRLGPCKS